MPRLLYGSVATSMGVSSASQLIDIINTEGCFIKRYSR
jgi:hypothetical protein